MGAGDALELADGLGHDAGKLLGGNKAGDWTGWYKRSIPMPTTSMTSTYERKG